MIERLKPLHIGAVLVGLMAVFVMLWPTGLARDYLNHLARNHIQGHVSQDVLLQAYFSLSFDFIPDLSMDLVVPWLSHIIGTYPAGAIMMWLGFLIAPCAGLALSRALHGYVAWPALLGFLTVFNGNMDWGFVNYNFSIGLALLAFALWIKLVPGRQRTVIFLPIATFLCLNHAIAFLTFGYLAMIWELVSFARGERGNRRVFLGRAVLYDLTAMLGGLLYLYLSLQGTQDLPQAGEILMTLRLKADAIPAATAFHNGNLAIWSSYAVSIGLISCLMCGWLKFAPKTGWLCLAILVLIIAMPTIVFGIWGLHLRFSALLIILVGACVVPAPTLQPMQQRLMALAALMIGAQLMVNGATQMSRIDGIVDETRNVLQYVPKGQRLITGISPDFAFPAAVQNASATVVIDRSGYVPGLFTNTSYVDVTSGMIDIHMPQSGPILRENLLAYADLNLTHSSNGYWNLAYAHGWPARFDYLLYFKAIDEPPLALPELCVVRDVAQMTLYSLSSCEAP